MTPAADDPATAAWRAMRGLVLDHDRRATVADALEMSFTRVKLLRHLTGGPATLRELATALGADPPYATVMVDDLEGRGLVERGPHPSDGRAKMVALTPAGRRAAERADAMLDEPPERLRALDPADLRRIAELLAG